ncbi:hypothetical protein JW721_00625 [Candidatus Micrarchaeota archaeon]|nr:hypothetical protein [Candidatus Micrarchaeota archaeon]
MAKPILPTPSLRGRDAIRFAKDVLAEQESPSKERVATIRRAIKSFGYFEEQMRRQTVFP